MLSLDVYIFAIANFLFCYVRSKFLMLFFQQEEYRNTWFLKYIFRRAELIDKKLTFGLLLIWVLSLEFPILVWLMLPLFLVFMVSEHMFLTKAKKKLNITSRVKRILTVNSLLVAFTIGLCTIEYTQLMTAIIIAQLLPFLLILSNIILSPFENSIQNK